MLRIAILIACGIYAVLSAFGIWKPNRFGTTMLWIMVGWGVYFS